MMELLGYIAAVLILGFALILFHNVLFEEDENKSGLSVDLTGVAIFLIMHAVVAALTSATFALIGSAVVILGMLRPVRYVRHRIEAAGFDTTRRTFNAPVDATPATETPVADDPVEVDDIDPVEVREPVTPDGGGLTESENRVWEDLTKRLDD